MKTKTGKGNDEIVLFLHHFLIQHPQHPPTRCFGGYYHSDATKDESFCIMLFHFLTYLPHIDTVVRTITYYPSVLVFVEFAELKTITGQ